MGAVMFATVAVGLVGITATLIVLYREGHLDDVRLPRWMGWFLDVDDAYDVWPAEHEHRPIVALHEEAHRFDTYQENRHER